jgi:hypothetical protein
MLPGGAASWYEPHPYGVLPLGNQPPSTAGNQTTHRRTMNRLGSLSALLLGPAATEQACLDLLCDLVTFLEVEDVCQLSASCSGLYILLHAGDAWKQLYHVMSPQRLVFCGSWKESAVRMRLGRLGIGGEKRVRRHTHIRISRDRAVYNDTLFQSWLCTILPTTYKLTPPPGLRSRLPPVPALPATLSVAEFDRFEANNTPLLIVGGATAWPLFKLLAGDMQNLWRHQDKIFGGTADRSPALFRCEHTHMTVEDYCRYAKQQRDERPIYLFDSEFRDSGAMRADMFTVPETFGRDDFFKVLGPHMRPKYRWLIAGPKRGGSSFHVDPNYTSAWNACLTGRKRWIMFPPGCVPCGIYPSEDMSNVTAPQSLSEWLLNHYDASVAKYSKEGREVIANAGDIVFVPCGWWHFVVNLADSVAITQNYVSRHNLAKVLLFLQKLPKSISGIGEDEPDGEQLTAVRRCRIAKEFEDGMRRKYPEQLERALAERRHTLEQREGVCRRKRPREESPSQEQFSLLDDSVGDAGFAFTFSELQ